MLPGLASSLEPQLLIDTLLDRSTLPSISSARVCYIKYKPGINCLVGYQLDTGEGCVNAYARALRRDDYASFQGKLANGCIRIDAQALELRLFPYDRRLPRLRLLAEPARQQKLLKRLFPEKPDWWQGQLECLAYKPERRYVARLIIDQRPRAVLKFHTPNGYAAAWRAARATQSHANLSPLLGLSECDHVLAYAWLEGCVASTALLDETWPITGCVQIGAALAALHTQPASGLPVRQRSAEIEALHAALHAVVTLCPQLAMRMQALYETLSIHLNTMPTTPGLIHGDFYARQILLQDSEVALIDLDEAAYANRMLDLANMLAHIEHDVLAGMLRRERADLARANLLLGYMQAQHKCSNITLDEQLDKLDLLVATRLLMLAPQPFRRYEPDWPSRIQAIVERCETLIGS